MEIERRLAELGIELPMARPPVANYVNAVLTGNLLFLAGKGPTHPDGTDSTGIVGADVTVEQAYQDARLAGLQLIAAMKAELGDLDRVARIVKVLGMVNAAPGFGQHPAVINGCSDLFVEVFGDRGRHARSAVGMGSLPNNITVEIEAVVEVAQASAQPGHRRGHFTQGVDDGIGAQLARRDRREAEANQDAGHGGRPCGQEVVAAVADHDRGARRHLELGQHGGEVAGVGLADPGQAVAADDGVEGRLQIQRAQQAQGRRVRLVGAQADAPAVPA
jgi:enamine deaminase RidA (YjgF/YER057c/UK114 family)